MDVQSSPLYFHCVGVMDMKQVTSTDIEGKRSTEENLSR